MMDLIAPLSRRQILLQSLLVLACGLLACVFSLNGLIRHVAKDWTGSSGNALRNIARLPDAVYYIIPGGKYFALELLFRWVLLSLAGYVCLLALNSIRHQTINIFASGMGGLLLGLFALTWMSLLVVLVLLILFVIAWIYAALQWLIAGILAFLLWTPVLVVLIGLITIGVAIALMRLFKDISWGQIFVWIKELLEGLSVKLFVSLAGLLGVFAFTWLVLIPLWRYYITPILKAIQAWLIEYVVPIITLVFSVLGTAVVVLVGVAALLMILILLGLQLLDQLSAARFCGRDMRNSFSAGFAVGAALGLALLVCSVNPEYHALINSAWGHTSPVLIDSDIIATTYALMPARAEALLQGLLNKSSPPIFDLALLVATLFLANCSLLMGLLSGVTVEPLRELFSLQRMPPLFKALFFVVFGLGIMVLGSATQDD
ncbi:MAG: hypothetical protein QOE77_2739 [Blastocatellia bacterium]|jgi:hypothetical protein|nr:hypothetical protein [Blastocatellia bacterium]